MKRDIFFNDIDTKIVMTDTAGQERFGGLAQSFFKTTEGVILVFDITERKTFDRL